MKNLISITALLTGLIVFSFSSCDIVEDPYMTTNNLTIIDTSSTIKKILIEKFTGHKCSNCPGAAEMLNGIQDAYGTRVIGIAIHPKEPAAFTRPWPGDYSYDFRTKWGIEIEDKFEATQNGIPTGMVNRINGGDLIEHDSWGDYVVTELAKDAIFKITLSSDLNSLIGTVEVNIEALTNLSDQYNVVVCLTEDHIVKWQDVSGVDNPDYEHNHVLRRVLNDTYLGDSIGVSFSEGDLFTKIYGINLDDFETYNIDYSQNNLTFGNGNCGGWEANNMNVVAYIYNVSTEEIVQAEEIHLINN